MLTIDSGGELETYAVRCVEIKKKRKERSSTLVRMGTILDGAFLSSKNAEREKSEPLVTANRNGPLSWVTILGCLLSTGLFISSIVFGDGMSLVATLLLSLLSTLTGIANKWELKLPVRGCHDAPAGDTVIRYPNGSYLVVRCEEEIARELYFAPEEIDYKIKSPAIYRMISLLGTIVLMLGIIALANAKLQLQFAWAGAYVIINAAHWVVAALPQRLHWDLDCYEIREQGVEGGPHNSSFTEALWQAILLTDDIRWVKNGNAAPQTAVWDEWLEQAEEVAHKRGQTTGPLKEPMFGSSASQQKATIWMSPQGWDPKDAWNKINKGETDSFRSSSDAGDIHVVPSTVAGARAPLPASAPPTMPASTLSRP